MYETRANRAISYVILAAIFKRQEAKDDRQAHMVLELILPRVEFNFFCIPATLKLHDLFQLVLQLPLHC